MICMLCDGELPQEGYLKLVEIDDCNDKHVAIFCGYNCLRHYYGWRRQ